MYELKMNRKIIFDELSFITSRSGGKGGQHVNKTESKVELIWNYGTTNGLSDEEKDILAKNAKNRFTESEIHVVSQLSRSQIKNREDAIKKFFILLEKLLIVPKKRKPTKVSKSVKEKRKKDKKFRKEIKTSRKKIY